MQLNNCYEIYLYIRKKENIIGNVNLCIVTVTQSITVNKKSPQQVLLFKLAIIAN